jgi:Ca-activated chloride channel family protein
VHPSDPSLDAQLRDIDVPPDLAARIKSSLAPDDGQLDARLRAVAVPESLAARLLDIPADARLDECLSDLAAPLTLAPSLRLVTPRERLRRVARFALRLSLAASWFIAISVMLGGGLAGFLRPAFPLADDQIDLVVMYDGPLSIDAEWTDPSPRVAFVAHETPQFDRPQPRGVSTTHLASLPISEPDLAPDVLPGAVGQWVSLVSSGLEPMDDAVLLRFGVLGSASLADDRLPEIDLPLMPRSAGIQPPLVRGYDRPFFQKHRLFPPLSPSAHPKLAVIDVPLVTESDVLRRMNRAVEERRLPAAAEFRVEDFLAATNYRFAAAPPGEAAIRTAAGPSPFGPAGTGLVQVGVQTGSLASRPQSCTHLVLAIDLSHSMSWGGRLEVIQHGIDRLLDQLQPDDRLSLVVFHEQVIHRVELATRADAASIRELLAGLAPRGGTNLAAGLSQAASLAMVDGLPTGCAKRLVLVTDSQVSMSPATLDKLRSLLVDARAAGVRLDVMDLADRDSPDPVLVDWATNLGGDVRPARTSRQAAWSLLEALAGSSPVVASDAKLTLHFNPQSVAAYRLVGHEANALAELSPVAVEAELAAGESATALVELWFRPGDEDDVGRAELTWRDAVGQPHHASQRISRLQFAPTFRESAVALQQAAIAAEIGQTLRGTREALREVGQRPSNPDGLAGVLALAARAHPQLRRRPDFQRLIELAQRLEKLAD